MKQCWQCNQKKSVSEFYPSMAKCKDCHKAAMATRRLEKLKDPEWVKQERARCREKQERRRALGLDKEPKERRKISCAKWTKANQKKRYAESAAEYAQRRGLLNQARSLRRLQIAGTCGKASRRLFEAVGRPLSLF